VLTTSSASSPSRVRCIHYAFTEPNGNRVTLDYLVATAMRRHSRGDRFSGRSLRFAYQVFFSGGRTVKRIIRLTGQNALSGGNLLGSTLPSSTTTSENLVKVTRKSPDPSPG